MCWQTRKRHIRYNVQTVSKGRCEIGSVFDLFEVLYTRTLRLLRFRFFNQQKYTYALGIKVKITIFHLYLDLISVIHLL